MYEQKQMTYRQILPPLLPSFPTLRAEFFSIITPNLLGVVHNMYAIFDYGPFRNEDWRTSVFASPSGKRTVFVCGAGIDRRDGA